MFDELSLPVRQAFVDAKSHASEFRGFPIEAEHILLALSTRPETQAARMLRACGLSTEAIRVGLAWRLESGNPGNGGLFFGTSLRPLLERAKTEAALLGATSISTGHLVLAMLTEPRSAAGQLLARAGLRLDEARMYVQNSAD